MFSLSPGQAHDAPEARKLLNRLVPQRENLFVVMDREYEGNETWQLVLALASLLSFLRPRLGFPPDLEMYKRRNEVERFR